MDELMEAIRAGRPIVCLGGEDLGDFASARSIVRMLSGNIHVAVHHAGQDPETDKPFRQEFIHNKIPGPGRNIVRDLILNIGAAPGFIAVGTGGTDPKDTDTQLEAEVFRAPITRRISLSSKVTFRLFLSTADANGSTLREVGLFARSTYTKESIPLGGGTLFNRAVYAPITKDNTIQVTYTIDINITSG
jgi:hypothetical protein